MLNKVIAWGPDRTTALAKLDRALADQVILGVGTNTAFLRSLISHPEVIAGRLDTGFIERHLDELVTAEVPDEALAVFALHQRATLEGPTLWEKPTGWRPTGPAALPWRLGAARWTDRPRVASEAATRSPSTTASPSPPSSAVTS